MSSDGVSMSTRFRETYDFDGGLEQAVVDLVRVGSNGHASGVRQLATRIIRTVPPEVGDPEAFRIALQAAIAPSEGVVLRFGAGEAPTEDGTSRELATVDPHPDEADLVLAPDTFAELREEDSAVAGNEQLSGLEAILDRVEDLVISICPYFTGDEERRAEALRLVNRCMAVLAGELEGDDE